MLKSPTRLLSTMASKSEPGKNIVVIGGGIIGSTTAYFLSHHPSFDKERDSITLLEATEIAGGASGKAGGLLALWAYPSCLVPLSYGLHKELAEKHNGAERWGYRGVHCGQIEMTGILAGTKASTKTTTTEDANPDANVSLQKLSNKTLGLLRAAGVPKELDWVAAEGIQSYEKMGDPNTTAQVHPYQFTTSMASLAEEKGVKIIYGSAKQINKSNGAVTGVTYTPTTTPNPGEEEEASQEEEEEEKTLHATTIILTAGPWTKTLHPSAPISALRAHSVTIQPTRPISAYCLFTSITLPRSTQATPEIYARPNNQVYACGEGDTLQALPPSTSTVQVDLSRCQDIVDQVGAISQELRDGVVTARQACYLPNVSTGGGGGGPIVGATGTRGLLIGAGHTCWGIQNAPGTGKCLSELVWEGRVKSARLGSLEPGRFGL
ncbi:FAD dependent oxidoreductase [Massarina eburnea CBS 473.64]|uniref:FAD dependent oxidoreductase n=1 Tax=Massarina eburnea CBS 473.64 TaxID=1395130 RepID=A0A6A6S041_9PLEO|nr:FAD dependent oxidoreductase [Massarina eburnea CBS 473.64]